MKIGINGFGRMGRLTFRSAFERFSKQDSSLQFVQSNDPSGDANVMAHILEFDSVHGRWQKNISVSGDEFSVMDELDEKGIAHTIKHTQNVDIEQTDWSECDIVLEASGKFKTLEQLNKYFDQGVKKVVVAAPVKEEGVANIVMGVNHNEYDPATHRIVTAASCTTNSLAPVVKVIHENLGIKHGSITTIHDITNTQTIIDKGYKDLRRARACGMSLIPTTTGSATAITHIFPELKGRLNGHAVRVPLTNASLTDCVFELKQKTSAEAVNELLKTATEGELKGILGFEEKPLVSIDYRTDPRSSVVDALSTMVVNETQLKLYLWYDNEWGYANRTAELLNRVVKLETE